MKLRTDNTARYYYHVSTKNFGKEKVLKPRDYGCNRAPNESKCPRICVSPSIEQCLIAVPGHSHTEYYVYRTQEKVKAKHINKTGIEDWRVTGEKWILEPTKFIKVTRIKNSDVFKIRYKLANSHSWKYSVGDKPVVKYQKIALKSLRKLNAFEEIYDLC